MMGEARKYRLVSGSDEDSSLEAEVNELIEKGWEPLGGVAVCTFPGRDYPVVVQYQAMVKREEVGS